MRQTKNVIILCCFILAAALVGCQTTQTNGGGPASRLITTFSQGTSYFYYNPPTLVNGHIYIGTSRKMHDDPASDNYFFKLDADLNKVWQYSLGTVEVRGGAALDSSGNVYFVIEVGRSSGDSSTAENYLYSLDSSGSSRWSRKILSAGNARDIGMENPAISADDRVYVCGDHFYAFDQSGTELWTYGSGQSLTLYNAPIIDASGNIYFAGLNSGGSAVVFSLTATGEVRWVFTPSVAGLSEALSSPAFCVNDSTIIVCLGNTIFAINTGTGAELWNFTPSGISGTFRGTPAVDNHDIIYVGSKASGDSVLYAVDAGGPTLVWEKALGADLYSSPCLGDDGTLYIGSERVGDRTRLHAIATSDGSTKWAEELDGDVTWSSPALANGGTLYIGAMSHDLAVGGKVYSFNTDSSGLLSGAGSARFHEGNQSTGRR